MSKQEVYAAQAAYESSLAAYEAFRAKHNDVVEEHDHLALALSESLEVLKTALRNNHTLVGSKFGSFKISVPRKYSYEALCEALKDNADNYAKVSYSVDSKRFEEAIKAGIISQDVADAVVTDDTPRVLGGPKAPGIYQR
jgi:hypothetical protein